jgi:hypothetical protein
MRCLYDVDPSLCGREMDAARTEYETAMNKCIFDSFLLAKTNFKSIKELGKKEKKFFYLLIF